MGFSRGAPGLEHLPSALSSNRMRKPAGDAIGDAAATKAFGVTQLGGRRMRSALLLSGLALCNFGALAKDMPYSKIGWWSVAYLELEKVNGCRAVAQFPDQTVFQMAQSEKAWIVLISNPRWNAWIGKRKELRL